MKQRNLSQGILKHHNHPDITETRSKRGKLGTQKSTGMVSSQDYGAKSGASHLKKCRYSPVLLEDLKYLLFKNVLILITRN